MSSSIFRALQSLSTHPEKQRDQRQSVVGGNAHTAVSAVQAIARDFGMGRRRSTGASGAEPMSRGLPAESKEAAKRRSQKISRLSTSGVSSQPVSSADVANYPGPHPASTATGAKPKPVPVPLSASPDDRFSTADRTILEEIKATIRAQQAHYTLKGVGHTVLGGGKGSGKKHHAYSIAEVPYPRAYSREVIDLDVWETLFMMDVCKSVSWHVFETPPTKVLDIGCGTGTWILECAKLWKETQFVGLDIVPLQPHLQNLGSPDLASRITWVQHNFLEVLPFQNEEFDYVHVKRIALGIPEDKWDAFFEEVARVMKPGGRFEIIEEDLYFPGKRHDLEKLTYGREDTTSALTRQDSASSGKGKRRESLDNGDNQNYAAASTNAGGSAPVPIVNGNNHASGISSSRPSSPVRSYGGASINGHRITRSIDEKTAQDLMLKPSGGGRHHAPANVVAPSISSTSGSSSQGFIPPHSRSADRPNLHLKTAAKDVQSELMYASSASVLGSMGYLAYQDPMAEAMRRQRKLEASMKKNNAPPPDARPRPSPFLATLMTRGPVNPQDHTILQAIWEGMLSGRFINTAPVSLLTTYLEYHFRDIRTHPPLVYTFPPTPPRRVTWDELQEKAAPIKLHPPSSPSDTDDAATNQRSPSLSPQFMGSGPSTTQTEDTERRWLSIQGIMTNKSPYVSFDGARGYAYSPSKRAIFKKLDHSTTPDEADGFLPEEMRKPFGGPMDTGTRLPNPTLHIDLNTLYLHLTVRAKEIVACSESMWEWVESIQAGRAESEARNGPSSAPPVPPAHIAGSDAPEDAPIDEYALREVVLDMTRDDFDSLLCNFEWDMLDKAGVGYVLEQRFAWNTVEGNLLPDRKNYDKACRLYEKWVVDQLKLKLKNKDKDARKSTSTSVPSIVLPPEETAAARSPPITQPPSQPLSSSPPTFTSASPSLLAAPSSSMEKESDPSLASILTEAQPETRSTNDSSEEEITFASTQVPPTEMMSRTMRVFVAWKPA